MSVQALSWVFDHSPTEGKHRLVLLSIANHAGGEPREGAWEAWPGLELIGREARVGVKRTVQRLVDALVKQGALEVVLHGAPDSRLRGDRRPNLYRIRLAHGMTAGVTSSGSDGATAGSDGATDPTARGDRSGLDEVTARVSPEPSLEPRAEPSVEPSSALAVPAAPVDWPVPDVVEKGGRLGEAVALCDRMARQVDARGYHVNGQARSKRWVLDMEQLIRLDERTPHAVELVLDWLDAGGDEVSSFWRTNVRSPATLRARWQQMAEQYQRLKGRGARGERGNNFGMDRADVDAVVEAARNGGPLRPTALSVASAAAGQLVEATSHEPREST